MEEPVENRRETALPVPDQGAEAQEQGYEKTVVPVSDLGVEEIIEKCGESVKPVPDLGSEGQEEGCEKTVIAKPGLYQEEQKGRCNETVIPVPDSVVEETAMPGPVSDLEVQKPGFCEKIVR